MNEYLSYKDLKIGSLYQYTPIKEESFYLELIFIVLDKTDIKFEYNSLKILYKHKNKVCIDNWIVYNDYPFRELK